MESEKIKVQGKDFYVNGESLYDPQVVKLFLFEDPELRNQAKTITGLARMVKKDDLEDALRESVGGAGYAVYGGSPGGFGNPSMGGRFYGRGFGFGSGQSNGGPNLMYTYDIKPLNQLLQQPGTPQGDERYVHVGTEITGKVLGKDQEVEGKILSIEHDEEGNILHYLVIEPDTAEKLKIDPTSITIITHEETPNASMMDFVGAVGEQFYPSFETFLNESKKDHREACQRSKLPKEIKEKILKMGLSKFENGRAWGLGKPKVKGKSFNGVSMGADKKGFFVYTHRARSESKPDPSKIPDKDIKFIKSTG